MVACKKFGIKRNLHAIKGCAYGIYPSLLVTFYSCNFTPEVGFLQNIIDQRLDQFIETEEREVTPKL